ncbi:helix-turn-helix domain-containing protein [Micromonospora sp. WMMD882]|uniref:helix-turn-helix domain-containing protein n=1 Tax=Micromonospora sp. WMMD882 TaxID=3015151 RepID=UPI0032B1095A
MSLLRRVIGGVLRRLRIGQGRTLREVAETAGVSVPYLSEVERGRKEASSEVLAAICRALGIRLSDLLEEARDDLRRLEPRTPVPQPRTLSGRRALPTGSRAAAGGKRVTPAGTRLSSAAARPGPTRPATPANQTPTARLAARRPAPTGRPGRPGNGHRTPLVSRRPTPVVGRPGVSGRHGVGPRVAIRHDAVPVLPRLVETYR